MDIGRVAEGLDDFKRGGLLSFEAEGIDRIDDGDGLRLADLAHEPQCVVEVPFDGDDFAAIHESLREFAERDFSRRQQHDARYASTRGVGGGSGAGVAGACADDGLCALLARFADGHGHAAILERSGGIQAFVFYENFATATDDGAEARRVDERRAAFVQRDDGCLFAHGQVCAPAGDNSSVVQRGKAHGAKKGRTIPQTRRRQQAGS